MKREPVESLNPVVGGRALLAGLLLSLGPAAQAVPPFEVEGPGVDPADFEVTVFASGLDFPNGMAELPDGSILVTAGDGAASYFSGTGQLIRLVDTDADGVADGAPQVIYSGLPKTLTALCIEDDLVFVAASAASITVLRMGATPADPLTPVGTVQFDYSGSKTYHGNSALHVRKTPATDNRYDLFFQLGAEENNLASTDIIPISSSDVLNTTGSLARGAAHMLTLQDHGTHMEFISVVQIATGLRNASGFAIHPTRGDLYFNDNGIDGLVDSNEPHSADELNRIPRPALGGATEDFGFPDNYTAYRTGVVVGGDGIQPLITFQPYTDPVTGLRSEGPNGISFAPPGFPQGLNTGIFIGFHGKFTFGGLANDENPVVYADPDTGEYFHFIRGQQDGIGHLDGLLSTRSSLYLADLSTGGGLSNNAGQGVIYKIESLAPVEPEISLNREAGNLLLQWDRGRLQQTSTPAGGWQPVEDAFSPFTVPDSPLPRFFRTEY